MRIIQVSILLALLTTQVGAQCQLRSESFPEVRGLRLAMSVDDIKHRYPNFPKPETDAYRYAEFTWNFMLERGRYESYGSDSKEPLQGIDKTDLAAINMSFLDQRLVALEVAYRDTVQWKGLDDFLTRIVDSLRLPTTSSWTRLNPTTAQLKCVDAVVQLTTTPKTGGSEIGFYKIGVKAELEKRKRDEIESRKRGFKPQL